MRDSLDVWYQRELDFFRSSCDEFSSRFPKIAARLNLGTTGIPDPHVERLIQAFAFLNARTRLKLEDSFPEIVDGMLSVLYPHMLLPIPSMSVIEMNLDQQQAELFSGHKIPVGTELDSESINGSRCRFRTCYPVELYPMTVESAELQARPFSGPPSPHRAQAASVFRVRLQTAGENTFAQYGFDSIRFFVNISNFENAARVIELLCTSALEVVISGENGEQAAAVLPATAIRQGGLADEEAVLPRSSRGFSGYSLLTEYFVLPQKYLFFEVTGITADVRAGLGKILEISVLLDEHEQDLESWISAKSIRTGCTPMINLFRKTADAIPLNYRQTEYKVIADARAEASLEVYSIGNVDLEDQQGETQKIAPFYSAGHGGDSGNGRYWHASRRPGAIEGDVRQGTADTPSELYLSLVDPQFSPWLPGQGLIHTEVTCFNRNLPVRLSERRGSRPIQFSLVSGGGIVKEVNCLVAPTPVCRNHLGRKNLWPLVSQLSLNHLSLTGADAQEALQEILTLNDPRKTQQTHQLTQGLNSISTEPCVQRMHSSFVRGTLTRLELNDENFSGDNAWLFASVLNQFLMMYTSINTFARLAATTASRRSRGLKDWTWSMEAGNRPLI